MRLLRSGRPWGQLGKMVGAVVVDAGSGLQLVESRRVRKTKSVASNGAERTSVVLRVDSFAEHQGVAEGVLALEAVGAVLFFLAPEGLSSVIRQKLIVR